MRSLIAVLISLSALFFVVERGYGQKKLIILVRHAEKDASATADANDPGLSSEGLKRAQRLVHAIRKYRPGAVYSTDLKRTRATVTPMAARRRKEIQIYDPKKQAGLAEEIQKSQIKRFLVVGHSNTIPELANLLTRKEIFKSPDENDFGTIWIVRTRDGKLVSVKIFNY